MVFTIFILPTPDRPDRQQQKSLYDFCSVFVNHRSIMDNMVHSCVMVTIRLFFICNFVLFSNLLSIRAKGTTFLHLRQNFVFNYITFVNCYFYFENVCLISAPVLDVTCCSIFLLLFCCNISIDASKPS